MLHPSLRRQDGDELAVKRYGIRAGQVIAYKVTVTNSGNVRMRHHGHDPLMARPIIDIRRPAR
jgi:hypothetical protein